MKKPLAVFDYSTRRKRRAALFSIIAALEQVSIAEETYRDSILPVNLKSSNAFDAADYCICLLDEAVDLLRSVYDDYHAT